MKYLCIGETYQSQGKEKTSWKRIGEMFEGKNGKSYVKFYIMPGILIHLFDAEKKGVPSVQTDDLRPDEDVPF